MGKRKLPKGEVEFRKREGKNLIVRGKNAEVCAKKKGLWGDSNTG